MGQPLQMIHEKDPKAALLAKLKGLDYVPLNDDVLLATYMRPAKTAGGILLTEKYRDEDKFQGKVGLVIALGPLAFEDDATHSFPDPKPKLHDWVVFNIGDTFGFDFGSHRPSGDDTESAHPMRVIKDVHIRGIVANPDLVW